MLNDANAPTPGQPRCRSTPGTPTNLTVFVASPGGLADERSAIDTIAGRLNATLGDLLDVRLTVKRYELLVGRAGAPQDQINPWVDDCDLFIGIVHRRWGSPTDEFDSGFAEEFERALRRQKKSGTPEITLFFKEVDEQSLGDPGPQLLRVRDFRQRVEAERLAFYTQFQTTSEFEILVLQLLVEEMHKRGRIGATGEGYSPSRSAADRSREVADSSVEDDGELETVLRRFSITVTGGQPDGPLDFDRLELFALSGSRDAIEIPVHLINRIFQKHADTAFRRIELDAWLRTYVHDLGRVKYSSERVVPYPLAVGGADHLQSQLAANFFGLLGDEDANVRQGALCAATALRIRPAAIWARVPKTRDEIDAYVQIWSRATRSVSDVTRAVEYWLAVHTRGDATRARLLLKSDTGETRDLGRVLVGLLGETRDATPLAEVSPNLLDSTEVRARFPGGNPLSSLSRSALEQVVEKYGTEDAVRLKALGELRRRDEISEKLLLHIINEKDYDSLFAPDWQRRARGILFDEPVSQSFTSRFLAIIGDLKRRDVVRELVARLARNNPAFRQGASESVDWDESETELSPERVSLVLQAAEGTDRYEEMARSVLRGDHPAQRAYIAGLARAGADEHVLEFVGQQMAIAAVRYLTRLSPPDRQAVRELRRMARSDRVLKHDAVDLLLPVADGEDVDFLLENLLFIVGTSRTEAIRQILEKASLGKLRELLRNASDGVAPAALAELRVRDRLPSNTQLWKLLYDKDSGLRMVALAILCDGRRDDEIAGFLGRYRNGPTLYYNVVCELDRRASGMPSTHPYSAT